MNKALRQSIQSAEQRGICLLCSPNCPCCCCTAAPGDLFAVQSEEREVFDLTQGNQVKAWHLCDACLGVIKVPDRRPAVRCPGCGNVN